MLLSELLTSRFEFHSTKSYCLQISFNVYCFAFILIVSYQTFCTIKSLQWRQSNFLILNCTNNWSNFDWISSTKRSFLMIRISRFTKFSIINWILKSCTSNFELWNKKTKFWNKKMLVFELVVMNIVKSLINWKKKIIVLRTQLDQHIERQNAYDSNAKQFRKFDLLHVDFHFFKRSISIFFFVSFIFFNIERFVISTTFMHDYHIKYSDIDDFHDDKEKWKQWKKNLLTKIWICFLQFSIEQHKINYVRRHTKKTAYDIIKTRTNIDNETFYSIIDELLKNLNVNFDQDKNIKQRKVYVKVFDDNFRMIEIEKFEIFIIRYIVVVVDFQIIDEILIHQLKMKLFSTLRYNIWHLIEIHEYQKFVEDFRYAIIDFEKFRIRRSEKSYSNFYSLTRKKKKQLDNIENCYKCHQSKHKINDKNAFCKHISWMLKQTKRWSFEQSYAKRFNI